MTVRDGNEMQQQMAATALHMEMAARTSPGSFRTNAAVMTLAGFAGLFGFAVLALFGIVFFLSLFLRFLFLIHFAALLFIPLAGFALLFWHVSGTLARTLCARMPDPKGIYVDPRTSPQLYQQVRALATVLDTPQISKIYVTNDFAIALRPRMRFGIFGGLDYDLLIGLPLLCALSPAQAKALLAHELGHLSMQIPAFHAWVHRVWDLWSAMMTLTECMDPNIITRPYLHFLTWYTRQFYLYEMVIARLDDLTADKCAARVTGSEVLRDALLIRAVRSYYLHEGYRSAALANARDVHAPTSELCGSLTTPWPPEAEEWLQRALQEPAGYDHHAALATRLRNLGVAAATLPPVPTDTAAPVMLGDIVDEVTRQLDALYPLPI